MLLLGAFGAGVFVMCVVGIFLSAIEDDYHAQDRP